MAIYSLAFLAPPELKRKVKTNRSLGFTAVMLRMIQKFLMNSNQEGRMWFLVCARKAIEAMKVVDKCEDSFETPKSTLSTMAFGMGYGEVWENGADAENVGVRPWLPRPLSVAETRWAPTDMSGSLALHMMLFTNISLFIIPLTCLDNSSTF